MYTLIGKVIDQITHVPIVDASVMLQKRGTTLTDIAQLTNENGKFYWKSLDIGDYELQVFCDGYQSQLLKYTCCEEASNTITVALDKK